MGLYLGCSLMSLIEVPYWGFVMMKMALKATKRLKEGQKKALLGSVLFIAVLIAITVGAMQLVEGEHTCQK